MLEGSSIPGASAGAAHGIPKPRRECLPLRDMDWLGGFLGGLQRGAVYLLGGAPGSRKSGMATQIALDLARQDIRSLFLLTEESDQRLRERTFPMMNDWSAAELCGGLVHIHTETAVPPMHQLPQFVRTEMLAPTGKWHALQCSLAVIDSAQGHGLSSAATRDYSGLIEAAQLMAAAGITVLIINHLTKGGQLAGPAAVEHAVDVAMVLKTAPIGRALFITKNRFGASGRADPVLLEIDDVTLRLVPSKHRLSTIAVAQSYGGGAEGVIDVQASVRTIDPNELTDRIVAQLSELSNCIKTMPTFALRQLLGSLVEKVVADMESKEVEIFLALPSSCVFSQENASDAMRLVGTTASSTSHDTHPQQVVWLAVAHCRYVKLGTSVCFECRRRAA